MDALNIIFQTSQFRPANLMLLEGRPNMIMPGKFTKIMYSDECITLNNLSLSLPLENAKVSGWSDTIANAKTFLSFPITSRQNSNNVSGIVEVEEFVLNYYINTTGSRKTKVSSLRDHLRSGYIKIYASGSGSASFVLRISGIWEDETRIGLTYKLMQQGTA